MKKILAISCLLTAFLMQGDTDQSLRTAIQQLKECFEGGNNTKNACYKTWESLTNCIFAQEIQDYKNTAFYPELQQINHTFMAAVERWKTQYEETIYASAKHHQKNSHNQDIQKARKTFYSGIECALEERRQAFDKLYQSHENNNRGVIIVTVPQFPLLAALFGGWFW